MKRSGVALLALLLGVTACHKNTRAAAPPPIPVPALSAAAVALRSGDSAFDSGDFARAAQSYETYLRSSPQMVEMDRVLFRYGVAQSMSSVATRQTAGNDTFNQLIRDFPQSAYVPPARVILALRADIVGLKADQKTRDDKIKQLNDELERLKKIDLDRRRKP